MVNLSIVHPDGTGLKQHLTQHGNFCGSPKWTADSKRVVAYCMTAEQTLDNRRGIPDTAEHADRRGGHRQRPDRGDAVRARA